MAADPTGPENPSPTVFLSYASGDRGAAQVIRDALPAFGLEIWYDESDLAGGDAWDQKIRKQIRECDFFMPVISAQTEARAEGYFRREWRLAVERTLDMADDRTFLLPVVIDDTPQSGARVPEKFLSVQWSRVPGGRPTAAFEAVCRRLASGQPSPQASTREGTRRARPAAAASSRELPEFPKQAPGEKVKFWLKVAVWCAQSAWILFTRFPRWVRIVVYVWLAVVLMSKGCTSSHRQKISSGDTQKLKEISDNYQGSINKADVAKLATQIAQSFSDSAGDNPGARNPLLVIPFAMPGDATAKKTANAAFAQMYGRVSISHPRRVGLADAPLPLANAATAAAQGRAQHATYVLYGTIDTRSGTSSLNVNIVAVEDGSTLWSKAYPVAGADPAKIAEEVDSKVSSLVTDEATRR